MLVDKKGVVEEVALDLKDFHPVKELKTCSAAVVARAHRERSGAVQLRSRSPFPDPLLKLHPLPFRFVAVFNGLASCEVKETVKAIR